jgi:RNA polymerase sigma factor (sigma-70 family)
MKDFSDKDLVQQYLNNPADATCFNELHQRYAHLIFGIAYKYLQDTERAETIRNDTFLQIRKIGEDIENLGAWLHIIARNKCLDVLRKENLEPKTLEFNEEIELTEKNDDFFVQKSDLLRHIEEEGESYILNKIENLPENLRECAILRFVDGAKYKEIANLMTLTEDEVRNNLQKARLILRKTIQLIRN